VAALQSADEFAGTADQDPVLSTIKPTSTIVPAIIERIMVSRLCVRRRKSAPFPLSPIDHAVADFIGIKVQLSQEFCLASPNRQTGNTR